MKETRKDLIAERDRLKRSNGQLRRRIATLDRELRERPTFVMIEARGEPIRFGEAFKLASNSKIKGFRIRLNFGEYDLVFDALQASARLPIKEKERNR